MSLGSYFKEASRELGSSLGIKYIDVRDDSSPHNIKVTRYIKVLHPAGHLTYLTEQDVRRCETLAISVRRV